MILELSHLKLLFSFHVEFLLIFMLFVSFMKGQEVQFCPHLDIPFIFLSGYFLFCSGTLALMTISLIFLCRLNAVRGGSSSMVLKMWFPKGTFLDPTLSLDLKLTPPLQVILLTYFTLHPRAPHFYVQSHDLTSNKLAQLGFWRTPPSVKFILYSRIYKLLWFHIIAFP